MQWPKRLRWPWRKRSGAKSPPPKALSLRHLYGRYQRQQKMWVYVVLSSMILMILFLALSLLSMVNPWALLIPVLGIAFAISQSRRCRDIIQTVRQALITQQQIAKAQAEAAAAAAAAEGADGGQEQAQAGRPRPTDIPPDGDNSPGGNGRRTPKE